MIWNFKSIKELVQVHTYCIPILLLLIQLPSSHIPLTHSSIGFISAFSFLVWTNSDKTNVGYVFSQESEVRVLYLHSTLKSKIVTRKFANAEKRCATDGRLSFSQSSAVKRVSLVLSLVMHYKALLCRYSNWARTFRTARHAKKVERVCS